MDVAERMQCPPDFPAVAVMIAAGSLIGRQIAIRPKRQDDWTVVANLWGAAIGRPSLMKSPALREALLPLVAMEAEAAEQHREAVADWEAGQVVAKEAAKVNATEIRKAPKANNPSAAHALARQDLQSTNEPARRRYVVNDTTVEKLGVILAANPNGVLIFRDELTGFVRAMDRDEHEQDRAFYLESWNGCGRYTVDRVGRGTLDRGLLRLDPRWHPAGSAVGLSSGCRSAGCRRRRVHAAVSAGGVARCSGDMAERRQMA
jgi:putative DNA primase/helicase